MAENKFIEKLKGTATSGAVLELQNKNITTSFGNMPHGSSNETYKYADHSGDAVVVAHGSMNWSVQGATLALVQGINSDGRDYTGESEVSGVSTQQGNNLWINSAYTFPANGDSATSMIFNPGCKWALKLCGDNLLVEGGNTVDFTVLVAVGATTLATKQFTVSEQANFFCKDLVIDFSESYANLFKAGVGSQLKVQLFCNTAGASARLYQGMTTLTCLQRRVNADVVSSNDFNLGDIGAVLDSKVNIDGTSVMTAPLKFTSGSMRGAVGPYLNGVSFWKLDSQGNLTQVATLSDSQFIPAITSSIDLGGSTRNWKDLYLSGKAYITTINNGGDIEIPTKAGAMALESDIGRTNCITEIPQDIKLELNSGTLTLKAGSKVYVPNGAGVFDVRNITSDATLTDTSGANNVWLIAVSVSGGLLYRALANCTSGANATASSGFAYDTTANDIGWFTSDGTKTYSNVSFPICICSSSSSGFTSIDQVFNGFGYIGSTVFALPGLSVLAPDGRNTDGTLKNILWTANSVITRTESGSSGKTYLAINTTNNTFGIGQYQYDEFENYNKLNGDISAGRCVVAQITNTSGGVITNLTPKTVFHAVDYNDTDFIGHQAMPSDRYVDLTLGASGATYTAPADGYITIAKTSGVADAYVSIDVVSNNERIINAFTETSTTTRGLALSVPVSKGNVVYVYYSATGTTTRFRFIYANGSK